MQIKLIQCDLSIMIIKWSGIMRFYTGAQLVRGGRGEV